MNPTVYTLDIESRWRVLDDAESDVALQRLVDVERQLRNKRPLLLPFYTALVAGTAKTDLLETVRQVLADVVIAFLRNPDLNNRQDIGADGSIGIGFDMNRSGRVLLTDDDLALIDEAVAGAAGVVSPKVGSQVLVSSFPWRRTPYDVTILPTP